MRDRLTTLAGALLALAIVYLLFFAGDEPEVEITRPVTTEQGPNGYLALHRWLTESGLAVVSLRERFDQLAARSGPAAQGNVLVTTLPHYRPMRESEAPFVADWVSRGNTLLVVAAINDTPDWSMASSGSLIGDLEILTDIEFYAIDNHVDDPEEDDTYDLLFLFEDSGEAQEYTMDPVAGHPLMRGVDRLRATSDYVSSVWEAYDLDYELTLQLATMSETGTAVIWQRRFGDGQVIVLGSGTMLSNRMIARDDNRQFVLNLLAAHLAADGSIVFDDLHQGVSALYDPEAFFADSRLHRTILFVLGFWLLYIVGSSNRLLDPQPPARALRQSDFLEATGGFIHRHTSRDATGLWMFRSWFNDLRRHMGLQPNGEPLWPELAQLTTLDKRLLARMQRQYRLLSAGHSVNLIDLHNTIRQARKTIG